MQNDETREAVEELRSYIVRARGRGMDVLYRSNGVEPAGLNSTGGEADRVVENETQEVGKREMTAQERTGGTPGLMEEGIKRRIKTAGQQGLFGGGESEGDRRLDHHNLEQLEREVSECTGCGLSEGRTNTVFGAGAPHADILFIGEAPGRDEDLQGIPFVGRAGKLLTRMLAAIDLSREEVYISNILKCRPPRNRDPVEEEVFACEGFLQRQIELIQPVVICALGRVAAQNLLQTKLSLSKLRNRIHYYGDTRVLATYHPAALLRNPHFKRPSWEDLKKLREIYQGDAGK